MIYFNWSELLLLSRKDMAGILCLTHGLNPRYNELSTRTMMKRLGINHVPNSLFSDNLFYQSSTKLTCLYSTREPQSYIKNPYFLYMHVPVRQRVVYLKALSLRKISNNEDFIPRRYFSKVKSNLFLRITEDKIYFPYESSKER